MNFLIRKTVACLALLTSLQAAAHEFWLVPQTYSPRAGSSEKLRIFVGEHFSGQQIGIAASHTAAMQVFSRSGTQNLLARLPADQVLPDVDVTLGSAGAHVIAFDSQPTELTLSADKFHAYLHEEGLDAIIKQREAAGTAASPGRERFRRNVKTLLTVGGRSDATFAVKTGQRLEILPLADPARKGINDPLQFRIRFDDRPLPGMLVKAWHKRDGQLVTIRTTSDAAGHVTFTLPYAGEWMISVVHMIPVTDSATVDWDSYWGNLTFALTAGRRDARGG